jgi:hypothetical protein
VERDRGAGLEPQYRIPSFGELEGKRLFADLRVAWAPEGLAFALEVTGKQQAPWCRLARMEESDGLHVFLDTRDTRTIHRASRYCHRFVFLPSGAGPRGDLPLAALLPINRAKEDPREIPPRILQVRSRIRHDGYTLSAFVPERALTGYDPAEHPRLGFFYAVIDRELGWQTLTVGAEFPFFEDPSLWGTLDLHVAALDRPQKGIPKHEGPDAD